MLFQVWTAEWMDKTKNSNFNFPGASHCNDLDSASIYDTPEMAAVKQRIKYLVALWLGNLAVPY